MTREQAREFTAFAGDWAAHYAAYYHCDAEDVPIDIAVAVASSIASDTDEQATRWQRRARAFVERWREEAGA